MSELTRRGVRDILIAMIDGLTGFPAAIAAVFPATVIHQCVVHLVRQSLRYVSWKDRKHITAPLRAIYQAANEPAALAALARFEASALGGRHPEIALLWRRHWERVAPALAYPLAVRRLVYSTNAIRACT